MSDFIREVDEDYRRDRIMRFFSRYAVVLAVLAVLIVAAAVAYRVWLDRGQESARQANSRYEAALALSQAGDDRQARAAFDAIAKAGPAGYATLSRMQVAETLAPKDPEAAAKAFDAIADDQAIGPAMRDTARYRGAVLRVDSEDPKAFERRYGGYAMGGFAFTNGMRELLALAALKRDDYAAAGRFLDSIIVDPLATPAQRARAQVFRALVASGPATAMKGVPPAATLTPVEPSKQSRPAAATKRPAANQAPAATQTPATPPPAVAATPPASAPASATPQAPAAK